MASQLVVGVAADEEELAVGGGEAGCGVGDFFRGEGEGEFAEDERHEGALRRAGDELSGRIGEDAGQVFFGFVHGAAEVAGLMDGVGVGEEQPAAPGALSRGPAGVVLAGPAFFELERVEHCDARKALGDGAGLVGAAVVDDDQLPILAEEEDVFGLGGEGDEAGAEAILFVAGGDDDGELEREGRR